MSFTDGKPFAATNEDLKRSWSGGKDGKYFRCYLCGHRFKEGDIVRWQYTNDTPGAGGNPFVCVKCDGTREEIIEKWKQMHIEVRQKFWWFRAGFVQD